MPAQKRKYTKTQQLILNAYFGLLEEKEDSEISISEICKRAEVVRKTFYNNFSSKSDLLGFGINFFFDHWKPISLVSEQTMPEVYRSAFELIDARKDLFLLLQKRNLYKIAEEKLTEYCLDRWQIVEFIPFPSGFSEYYVSAMVSAFVSILKTWIARGFAESIDYMVALTDKLIQTSDSFPKSDNPLQDDIAN